MEFRTSIEQADSVYIRDVTVKSLSILIEKMDQEFFNSVNNQY